MVLRGEEVLDLGVGSTIEVETTQHPGKEIGKVWWNQKKLMEQSRSKNHLDKAVRWTVNREIWSNSRLIHLLEVHQGEEEVVVKVRGEEDFSRIDLGLKIQIRDHYRKIREEMAEGRDLDQIKS